VDDKAFIDGVQAGTTPAVVLADWLEEQGVPASAMRWLCEDYDRLRKLTKHVPFTEGNALLVSSVGPDVTTTSILLYDGTPLMINSHVTNGTWAWQASPDAGIRFGYFTLGGFAVRFDVFNPSLALLEPLSHTESPHTGP